jgi:signal transduction histidine kinase/DNA-binding response OmpR family regulator
MERTIMGDFTPLILVADDDDDARELVQWYLAGQDYRFIEAKDGGQALEMVREHRPDLILLDINMPVMDGFTMLEQMRQEAEMASIVVIIMTAAYGRREDRLRGFALGADDYILKPLDRRELSARVRSRLRVKRLERDMRQQREDLKNLYQVAQEIATTLNPLELAKKLLAVAGQAIGAEDGWVILVNEHGDPLHAVRYGDTLSPEVARALSIQSLRQGIGGVVRRTETGLLIQDSAIDQRYHTGELGLSQIRSVVSVPLLGRRHNRGVLTFAHAEPNRFSQEHLQWLRSAAGQAAVALDNAYLFAREQRRAVQFRLLNSVSQDVSSILEMDRLLDVVVNLIQRTFGYYYVGLGLERNSQIVVQAVAKDAKDEEEGELLGVAYSEGVVAWVAENGRALLVNDVRKDPRYRAGAGLGETRSELALPIHAHGRVIGVLDIRARRVNAFEPGDVVMLETLAGQVSIAIQNAQLFRALSNQRERLNAILNSVTNAVLVVDEAGKLLVVNPAAQRLLQLTGDEIGLVVDLGVVPEELYPYFSQPIPVGETVVGRYRTDGEQSFQVVAAPVVVDGTRAGRVVLLQEVTHFEELSRLKDEFVATVSHDLKNPLTVIQGAAHFLAQPEVQEEDKARFVTRIQDSAGRMSTLISQLLDLGKLQSGMGLELVTVDVQPLLSEVVEGFRGQAAQKGLTLGLEAPPALSVRADAGRLRQVLENLLSNAVKYTPSGGMLQVEASVKGDYAQFKVQDTGLGIAPRDQPYVFDKFFRSQSDDTDEVEGTGLGLAIVKSIVERHDGQVWLESELGEGSTFYFTVPLGELTAESSVA